MCGIVYKSSFYTESDIPRFVKSCKLLNHRGPDEWGYVLNNRHMLGHKRLSIVDLINGHQPMSNDDHHLIYNGELYNIEELKRYLINDGIINTIFIIITITTFLYFNNKNLQKKCKNMCN